MLRYLIVGVNYVGEPHIYKDEHGQAFIDNGEDAIVIKANMRAKDIHHTYFIRQINVPNIEDESSGQV